MLTEKERYKTSKTVLTPSNQSLWRNSWKFYSKILRIIYHSYLGASKDKSYNLSKLQGHAYQILRVVEEIGGEIRLFGLHNLRESQTPVVFIANHMSALETFLLPAIILPFKDTTFILKKNLLSYPFFGKILYILDPVAVTRKDPREDLRVVLERGTDFLTKGRSIIVFPQQTRMKELDMKQFNSLGIKLAKRSGASIIPIALKTDLWANGKIIKDLGWIDCNKKVSVEFGKSITVESNGKEAHELVLNFIQSRLALWSKK